MFFLNKHTPFLWDEADQNSFEALKKTSLLASLLSLPNYTKEFILYLALSDSTVGIVLVQEDDHLQEHVIYYPSCALIGLELRYSHVEKLELAAMYVIKRLHHYILLRTTIVVAGVNPFQYVLMCRILRRKFNKSIVIIQEFEFTFQSAKSKNYLVFAEFISEFPSDEILGIEDEPFPDEHIFLISISGPRYEYILVYL